MDDLLGRACYFKRIVDRLSNHDVINGDHESQGKLHGSSMPLNMPYAFVTFSPSSNTVGPASLTGPVCLLVKGFYGTRYQSGFLFLNQCGGWFSLPALFFLSCQASIYQSIYIIRPAYRFC
jgi:hypothetical protein